MHWPRLSTLQIKQRIFEALENNLNYRSAKILGIPATFLDNEIFYEDAPFLKDAPFLSMLIANPNHIGCHTLEGGKEPLFNGTQAIEKDLIRICAEEIFQAAPGTYDGYVASGGTEANIEAAWIYRNYFRKEKNARLEEIALLYSEDTHYSLPKAANLLALGSVVVKVDDDTRAVCEDDLRRKLQAAVVAGKKYFIVCVNLSTTMFGSVDDPGVYARVLGEFPAEFRMHVDAAFGGFIYPFTNPGSVHHFGNPLISSITIDGHKMLQSPYGTGIFLARKDLMPYVCTEEASYVQGKDYTLCGSRSGANAACVWMILHQHGSVGWSVKMSNLLDRTGSLCSALDDIGVPYFRNPFLNIVTLRAEAVPGGLARAFTLVPDDHERPRWYKIVMMPHVRQGIVDEFLSRLQSTTPVQRPNRWT